MLQVSNKGDLVFQTADKSFVFASFSKIDEFIPLGDEPRRRQYDGWSFVKTKKFLKQFG